MAPPTFIQESRLGRVIFQIRDGALHISASRFGGGFDEYRIDLRRLDPDYQALAMRLYFPLGLAGLILVLCSLALWGLYQQTVIPMEALSYFMHWPFYGIGVSLIMAIRYSTRIEYFQFFDNWRKPSFIIVRETPQVEECAGFIQTLVSHIELAQTDLPPNERNALLQQFARENASVFQPSADVAYWKLSLVLGALATAIPWVPGLAYYLDLFHFMIIFWLCAGGAMCCAFSYMKDEPRRHWSLLGLILSLIPPYFY